MHMTQSDLTERGITRESEVNAPFVDPESGLSATQAVQRLAEDGPNALPGCRG